MKLCDYKVAFILIITITTFAIATPLDDYINAPASHYRYTLTKTIENPIGKIHILKMFSQAYRSTPEVDRTLWQHWLTIYEPGNVTCKKALLWIGTGSSDSPLQKGISTDLHMLSYNLQAIVVNLTMVPNQPLTFSDSKGKKSEDAIIAYTFDKFMTTGDDTWPVLLPMVKSVVRAMDATNNHLTSTSDGRLNINEFVLSGISKRGWAAWLTAAVDKRVIAIVPISIDMLNLDEQMKHHRSAYGRYSEAAGDYTKLKIFDRLDTKEGQALLKIVDPYEYRNRYTMPKYIINSAGDQFFLPDSAQFYYHDLPNPKYLRYVPNTNHSLTESPLSKDRFTNTDAFKSLTAFTKAIMHNKPLPRYTWKIKDDDSIEVRTQMTPKTVTLWQTQNPRARDFRQRHLFMSPNPRMGSRFSPFGAWIDSPLPPQSPGLYVAKITTPEKGWAAFFVELTYDSDSSIPYKFTTEVCVLPKTMPFPEKR